MLYFIINVNKNTIFILNSLIKMGILKLMDFLKDKFPRCIKDILPSALKGKVIAIDASNVIYQFLVQTQGKL